MRKIWIWIAWHLPRDLAYWAAVRVNTSATVTEFTNRTPEQVNIVEALRVWH